MGKNGSVVSSSSARFGLSIELEGVVKWFDDVKGFGFLVPDDQHPDVFLSIDIVRASGLKTVGDGSRVVFEAAVDKRKGKWSCMKLISVVAPSQRALPAKTNEAITPIGGLERAQVKWFNRLRGFGFLTRGAKTPDIFVHMETLRRYGLVELRPGQTILVRFGPGPKGLMATEVRSDGGALGPATH